jgi:alanine-synthesizing transaminase
VVTFSRRVPHTLELNRIALARSRTASVPYDLSISNPTVCGLPYPDDLLAHLADPRGLIYRPDPIGPLPTRRAVANGYRRWGVEVDPGRIVLTASTSEAYSLIFKLLCDPGDTVLAPTPSYPLFDHLSRLDGVRIHPLPLDPDDDWRPDLTALDDAPPGTRALIVVHPNNPTGSHVHPEDAAALAARCRDRGWGLLADEVFLPFHLDGGPGVELSFANQSDALTLTLGGLSKSIGLPQLKLAWIVVGGPRDLVASALQRLEVIADAYLSVSTPVALAAPRLMEAAAGVQRAIADRCRSNLDTLRRVAAGFPALSVPAVGGGWSALVRLPAVLDDEEITLRLLTEWGVAVQPGFFFDLPYDGAIVLSLLTPEKVWRAGLDTIIKAVRSWM